MRHHSQEKGLDIISSHKLYFKTGNGNNNTLEQRNSAIMVSDEGAGGVPFPDEKDQSEMKSFM